MKISDSKTLKEIQEEFTSKFPGLKIEFYKDAHQPGETSSSETINLTKTIGEVRLVTTSGELSIDGHQKVSTLEENFKTNYGLNVQVFRMSGNLWLQTATTDDWTLSKQNRKGVHSITAFDKKTAD